MWESSNLLFLILSINLHTSNSAKAFSWLWTAWKSQRSIFFPQWFYSLLKATENTVIFQPPTSSETTLIMLPCQRAPAGSEIIWVCLNCPIGSWIYSINSEMLNNCTVIIASSFWLSITFYTYYIFYKRFCKVRSTCKYFFCVSWWHNVEGFFFN